MAQKHSTNAEDYIIEKYDDPEMGINPHTLCTAWFRFREWRPESRTYLVTSRYGSRDIIETILEARGVDTSQLPKTVDLYLY